MYKGNIIAVGYARVSSKKQQEEVDALAVQEAKIRDAATSSGYVLDNIYSEVGSAVAEDSIESREKFRAAVQEAVARDAVLIVVDPTRLFRNVRAAQKFLSETKIRVFSVAGGRLLSKATLLAAVKAGEVAARNIQQGTVQALSQGKREPYAHPADAGRLGKKASQPVQSSKKDERTRRYVEIFLDNPAVRTMTYNELASYLNEQGVKSAHGKDWNKGTVRKMRKNVMPLVEEEQKRLDAASADPGDGQVLSIEEEAQRQIDKLLEEEAIKQNPNWGIF